MTWKTDDERRSPIQPSAACANAASVSLDEIADHGQTQPQSSMLPRGTSVCLPETFEHMRQELGKDTIAGVLDDDFSIAAGGFQEQLDAAIQGSELDCIGKQVPDD